MYIEPHTRAMESVALVFMLCCLLCSLNGGSSQCLDNIPQYGSRGTDPGVPRLESDNVYIIPNYRFSCYGSVAQWGACVERQGPGEEYTVTFIVYRPSDDPLFPDCYSRIGSNVIIDGTATDGCITLNVPVSDQISVEPGDVVGFIHFELSGTNGIEVDVTVSSVTAWYNTVGNFDIGPSGCPYSIRQGGSFPKSTPAAPVITAIVETSTPSPSHSTSFPISTPSPSTILSPSSPTQDGGSTLSTSTVAGIAAGAVGGVLLITTILILLTTVIIYKFRVKSTSSGDPSKHSKSYALTNTNPITHSEPYTAIQANDITADEMEQNEANQSATDTITIEQNEAYQAATNAVIMEQNEAYQSATNTVTMEQNEAYSGTVVRATQDVTYEEVDGLYEEVH